ncbi:hypothetical protein HBN54_004519 [Hymenobacter sp. 1B]|uniref:Uncharacterized protein n=1 Tax=Hymenobacter artigasi TaxID=2719616 RepID=A0ABX1HRN4_9BACT|nr:hypothetical protein [Hymenobacter artigasi]
MLKNRFYAFFQHKGERKEPILCFPLFHFPIAWQ